MSLVFLNYKQPVWTLSFLTNSITAYLSPELISLSYLTTFLYQINKYLTQFITSLEREKKSYRTKLNKKLHEDINQKVQELNEEIGIINKKLKSLFELSNYSLSSSDIEDMATRVVKGLKNLGYTGVFFYLNKNKKLYKDGFFPNLVPILQENINIYEQDKYLLLPIKVSDEKIGTLGIYKKTNLSEDEKKYLSIYANTISIFLEKVYYSKEIIKLREITLKVLDAVDIAIAVVDKEFNIKFENRSFQNLIEEKDNYNLLKLLPQIEPLLILLSLLSSILF
ncbi:MAG: hypothetical protein GXO22_00695, partial [Aquificae bacterium]|nr:hypothetical protein [Aquificota bacterium]